MKLRKILSAATAVAVAVSAAAVTTATSFAELGEGFDASSGHFICLVSNDSNVPVLKNSALAGDIRTVSLTVKTKDKDFEASVNDGTVWYGGGFGVNSSSTGWKQLGEWSIQDGIKDLTLVPTDTRYEYKLTYTSDTAIVTDSEEYCFFWFQDWTKGTTFDVANIELLNADGVDIRTLDAEVPADTTAPADEETTPAESEESVESEEYTDEETGEYTDESEEYTDEADTAESDAASDEATDDAASGTTTTDKTSPDTGVAGVAAIAGVAALAGAAVVVARKRK